MKPQLKIGLSYAERYFCTLLGNAAYTKVRRAIRRSKPTFDELEFVRLLLLGQHPPGVMIDVGAHHGESFNFFAYNGWEVLAFEPDPDPLKRAMIRGRSTARVQLFDCAISNEDGLEVPFYSSPESSGVSSLSPFLQTHRAVDRVVKTRTLANILRESSMNRRIDFLKIDTEGHDLFVLQGMDWDNHQWRPAVILCEFEDGKTTSLGYDFNDLGRFLLERDYLVMLSEWAPITGYGGSHQWKSIRQFPCDLGDSEGWGNFLALDRHFAARQKDQILSVCPELKLDGVQR